MSRQQFRGGRFRSEAVQDAADAGVLAGLLLVADIDFAGRMVAHQHRRQRGLDAARKGEGGHFGGDFRAIRSARVLPSRMMALMIESAGFHHVDAAAAAIELDVAIDQSEEGVIVPLAHAFAGMEYGAHLADQDIAGRTNWPPKRFTPWLGDRNAAVAVEP